MSRHSKKKRHTGAIIALVLILLVAAYGYTTYQMPLPALAAQPVAQPEATAADPLLPWPHYGGAAIGAVGYGLLASYHGSKPIPTASTAKTMTALAVLNQRPLAVGELGPTITLTGKDVGYFEYYYAHGGSLAKVAAGEKITEYQALQALMLPSANNMAETLADWAFGSQTAYLHYANTYALRLGMKDATFTDASGFNPTTQASPADMVRLGIAAIQNPVLAQIVSQKSAKIPVAGTINNVNWLLGYRGIDGIKTGSTDQDGGAFLFAAPKTYPNGQKITIVGAIMGGKTLQQSMNDSVPLITAAQNSFKQTTLISKGQVAGHYVIPWGVDVDAVAAKSLSVLAWPGRQTTPNITLFQIKATTPKSAKVGTIAVDSDPKKSVSVVVNQPIVQPGWYWRVTRHL